MMKQPISTKRILTHSCILALLTAELISPAQAMPAAPVFLTGQSIEQVAARHRHHVRHRHVVVVRPWHRRPHYGRLIAGVVLGTVIVVAVAGTIPPQPSPEVCWYWSSSRKVNGYWDYCQ